MSQKQSRAEEIIKHEVANFLNSESNRTSLITVTDIDLAADMRRATILVTVYPEKSTGSALDFLNRKRNDVRVHLKKHTKLRHLPRIAFQVDEGEKNRQRIDRLLGEE